MQIFYAPFLAPQGMSVGKGTTEEGSALALRPALVPRRRRRFSMPWAARGVLIPRPTTPVGGPVIQIHKVGPRLRTKPGVWVGRQRLAPEVSCRAAVIGALWFTP